MIGGDKKGKKILKCVSKTYVCQFIKYIEKKNIVSDDLKFMNDRMVATFEKSIFDDLNIEEEEVLEPQLLFAEPNFKLKVFANDEDNFNNYFIGSMIFGFAFGFVARSIINCKK